MLSTIIQANTTNATGHPIHALEKLSQQPTHPAPVNADRRKDALEILSPRGQSTLNIQTTPPNQKPCFKTHNRTYSIGTLDSASATCDPLLFLSDEEITRWLSNSPVASASPRYTDPLVYSCWDKETQWRTYEAWHAVGDGVWWGRRRGRGRRCIDDYVEAKERVYMNQPTRQAILMQGKYSEIGENMEGEINAYAKK
ncbi:hypothetical protein GQ44DRAFT_729001 [Phaeosphaeriaceae sp. PMI808]|nr:hypothetical protein GQ44DRAFT_729001 [Phaeosphaeriaceae sp. PMI808]